MSFKKEKNGFNRMPSHSQVHLLLSTCQLAPVIVRADGVAWMSAAKMMSSVTDWECSFSGIQLEQYFSTTNSVANFSEFPY